MTGKNYDCEATLSDGQVMDFCRNGYLVLEGVVADEVNRRAVAFLNEYDGPEPTEILQQDWFVDGVIKNRC